MGVRFSFVFPQYDDVGGFILTDDEGNEYGLEITKR